MNTPTPKQTIPMKAVRNDRKTTLTHDFIPGHKYEVTVRAIGEDGQQQAMESATRNTIVVQGKLDSPSVPSGLAVTGYLNDLYLTWTNPANYDFSHVEIWMSSTNDIATATKIAITAGITYIDAVGEPEITRYYWIRAFNTSQEVSDYHPDTIEGIGGTSVLIDSLWIGSVNADTITTGTLTGRTVQTAFPGSGQRMVMEVSDNTFRGYNVNGDNFITIDDNITGTRPGIKLEDSAYGGIVYIVNDIDNYSLLTEIELFIVGNSQDCRIEIIKKFTDGESVISAARGSGYTGHVYEGKLSNSVNYWVDEAGNAHFAGDITVDGTVDGVNVADHSARHENGGADEISVADLSGLLADAQTPLAHDFDAHDVAVGDQGKFIQVNPGAPNLRWRTPTNVRADISAAILGANDDITSMTALLSITRATGGSFDINLGNAAGDDFIVDTNKVIVQGDTGYVGLGATPTQPFSMGEKICMTALGGLAIKLTNKSGGVTVQGQLVFAYSATAVDGAFDVAGLSQDNVIGIVLEAGVADGSEAWIVISGIAEVLMDAGGSVRGDRIISSGNIAGSGDVWNAGGAVATHFLEIGHCIESVGGIGLARCIVHFN